MNNLIEQIRKSRPELAESSLLSYYNQLKKLHKEIALNVCILLLNVSLEPTNTEDLWFM